MMTRLIADVDDRQSLSSDGVDRRDRRVSVRVDICICKDSQLEVDLLISAVELSTSGVDRAVE